MQQDCTDDIAALERFIVRAKRAAYVGGGLAGPSSRAGSHDIAFDEDGWRYLDSYFGGTDFAGQEVVWHENTPVWAMNYHGMILRRDVIDAHEAGSVIKSALSALYDSGQRFLCGWRHDHPLGRYEDRNSGDVSCFTGQEANFRNGEAVYRLHYHGGLITP